MEDPVGGSGGVPENLTAMSHSEAYLLEDGVFLVVNIHRVRKQPAAMLVSWPASGLQRDLDT